MGFWYLLISTIDYRSHYIYPDKCFSCIAPDRAVHFLIRGGKAMIIDVTGIKLTPGNGGRDCLGNGRHFDENGRPYECCCDECNYMLCCIDAAGDMDCGECGDTDCPRKIKFTS